MTITEMLAEVTAQIRRDIPRLMELREGCLVRKDNEVFRIEENPKGDGYYVGRYFYLYEESIVEGYEIIGHDIMLNDVLEWLKNYKRKIIFDYKTGYFLDESDYYYSFSSNYHENAPIENRIWNLSSPYLNKDQSEELIKFLYNLKNEK